MYRSALCSVVLMVFLATFAVAQDDEAKRREFEQWIEYYREVAKAYDVRLKSSPDEPLDVTDDPVHVYTNPASGADSHGAFFVWTHKGRAEAIGAIWSRLTGGRSSRYVIHEFQSLSTEPFVAQWKEGVRWAPREAGIELKEVEGAPVPAESKALRLAQMRAIGRKFTGYHVHPTEFELRLLAQPLYRYEPPEDAREMTDGAVFGFFMNWDPEILLVLEVRPTEAGLRWHFGAGRFSDRPLRLEYGGTDVWTHGGGDFGDPEGPFYAKHGVDVRPVVLGE